MILFPSSTLNIEKLGFERAQPAETGRPGYDPCALLKLYLEVMWLLERLDPDYKSIAEFRRMH
jgi:hypothetical protein